MWTVLSQVPLSCWPPVRLKLPSLQDVLNKGEEMELSAVRESQGQWQWLYKPAHLMAQGGWGVFKLDVCLGYLLQGRRGSVKFSVETFGNSSLRWERKVRVWHSWFHSYKSLCSSVYFGSRHFRWSLQWLLPSPKAWEVWFLSRSELGMPETGSRATNSQFIALERDTQWQQVNNFPSLLHSEQNWR